MLFLNGSVATALMILFMLALDKFFDCYALKHENYFIKLNKKYLPITKMSIFIGIIYMGYPYIDSNHFQYIFAIWLVIIIYLLVTVVYQAIEYFKETNSSLNIIRIDKIQEEANNQDQDGIPESFRDFIENEIKFE